MSRRERDERFDRKRRLALAALLALVVAVAGGAFTATNTFSGGAGNAGDGNAAISGYDITNVQYQLQASDPTYLASVTFTVTPAAADVRAKVNAASTTYVTCTPATASAEKTCSFAAGTQTVLGADNLRVIAGS
jgi:hypothetical protein